ncbi:MAG TPA: riboflavin synthase [Candidatus Polarisedimenticolaceae bacterium]|nr:riboflavin synthase [Candidatus Polarisedimenticolaceae bacterium]
MFTGLVQGVGELVERVAHGRLLQLRIAWTDATPFEPGESIAVDGVCLTVTRGGRRHFDCDVVAATLARTTLGGARVAQRVNLERSLRLGERLGGHWVLGHVDAVAPVRGVRRRGEDVRLRIGWVPGIRRLVAARGSVALHGVSLTVAARDRAGFEVALVPATLARTNLGELRAGQSVNVEVDLLARYLETMLGPR